MPNKSNRGGLRDPAGGRPPTIREKKRRLIIDASDDEFDLIVDRIQNTRQRTELLLMIISEGETEFKPRAK